MIVRFAQVVGCFACLMCCACEVYTLSPHTPTGRPHPGFTATTSESAVYLFSEELHNHNFHAAASMLAPHTLAPDALSRSSRVPDMARLAHVLDGKPITDVHVDTLSDSQHIVTAMYNYYQPITFGTVRLQEIWYVASFTGIAPQSQPVVEPVD